MKLKPIDKRAELIEIIDKIYVKHNDLVSFEIGKPKFVGLTHIENIGNATLTELDIKITWRELV